MNLDLHPLMSHLRENTQECWNISFLMWSLSTSGRQWYIEFDGCSTMVQSEWFSKVFLMVRKGRIVGNILSHEKEFNHMASYKDIKIFKEVQRIRGELWNTKKRPVSEDSNTHGVVLRVGSSFPRGVLYIKLCGVISLRGDMRGCRSRLGLILKNL